MTLFQATIGQDTSSYLYYYNHKYSYLFDTKNKKKWISGPIPLKNVAFLYSSAIGINETAVLFLRASPAIPYIDASILDYNSEDKYKMNFIYDIESKLWTRIVDMPKDLQFASYNLPMTIAFDKNGTRLIQVLGFHEFFEPSIINDQNEATLWTLNLSLMLWSNKELFQSKFITYGKQ